ncbi:MAG: hypothetical protein RIR00_2321 [Pseudomonadota bacterium]
MKEEVLFYGLLQRQWCIGLTWQGWLLLLALLAGLGLWLGRGLYPFLAENRDVSRCEAMVVEGWMPDQAVARIVAEYQRRGCQRLFFTGGPIELGGPLLEFGSYAEVGARRAVHYGVPAAAVQAVPAAYAARDRTYTSALALRQWLEAQEGAQEGARLRGLQVMSFGPHARRTRLLFALALGEAYEVGVTALPPLDYPPESWWRFSGGVRAVIGEGIAFLYARWLFRPEQA